VSAIPPQSSSIDERIRALDSAPADTLLAAAADDADEALRAAAQQRLTQMWRDDPQQIAALVVSGSSTRVRQLAAQRIEDPDEADRLGRQVRDRDKSVYRILKAKSDARRAEQQRQAQLESDITGTCVALERFSRHLYDALYVPSFEHFEARWRALESQAPPQIRERAQQAIDHCLEVMASHVRERMQQAEAVAAEAARRAEQETAAAAAADAARAQAEQAAQAALDAAREREAEQRMREQQQAADALAARALGALIGKAHGALREGHTGPAAGIRRAIGEQLAAIAAPPPAILRRLQALDARLSELREWKDYAAAPKRAELIADMEALVGSTEPPPQLAARIRELRDAWKTVSKGIVLETQEDWQRFDRAATSAYQPCKEYFAQQARERTENVERRRTILQRLLAFEATQGGEQPDWRMIAQVLREARLEWRAIGPVERAANKPVEREFEAALARLHARLEGWYAENAAAKQALIARAQGLLASVEERDPLAELKQLQQQWQRIGITPRGQEQALWREFRAHCDAVFQQRQQVSAALDAQLRARHAQAIALCAGAEQLAALSGAELTAGMQAIPQWRTEFEALGELPRSEQRALRDRFERALDRCQAALAGQRKREAGRAWESLLEAGRHINAYAWALAQNAAADECAALKQAAESYIAGAQQWPKAGAQALKSCWARADAAGAADAASASGADGAADEEVRLRTLCIRAELHTSLPTPPEDQELRRAYQLQRLVQSMGRPQEANPGELDALCLEWLQGAPIATATYERLLARFMACRRARSDGTPARRATSSAR
jgi:hypothetical protein